MNHGTPPFKFYAKNLLKEIIFEKEITWSYTVKYNKYHC
jgi:hypothetical protein